MKSNRQQCANGGGQDPGDAFLTESTSNANEIDCCARVILAERNEK